MSLTAHWLMEAFDRKHAVLHAQVFDGSHTGDQIRIKFEEMFNEWAIKEDRIQQNLGLPQHCLIQGRTNLMEFLTLHVAMDT